jgi:hypothetical protein
MWNRSSPALGCYGGVSINRNYSTMGLFTLLIPLDNASHSEVMIHTKRLSKILNNQSMGKQLREKQAKMKAEDETRQRILQYASQASQ